jgi:cytochrome c553
VSCHESHQVRRARDPLAATSPMRAPATCGRCHRRSAEDFAASVHGQALAGAPRSRAASCVSCHGAHEAAGALATDRRLTTPRIAQTCGTCHATAKNADTEQMMQRLAEHSKYMETMQDRAALNVEMLRHQKMLDQMLELMQQ